MKRPQQHITERQSEKIFESILPSEWSISKLSPDYGKDYLVEIFEKKESTGKTFFVQLKGSEKDIKNNTFYISLEIDYIKYFKSLPIPILLVFVSITEQKVWGVWANTLIDSIKKKTNQKTVTVTLSEKYLIGSNFFDNVPIKIHTYKKLGITTKANSKTCNLLHNKLIEWINKYYASEVSTEFNNLPEHVIFDYKQNGQTITLNIHTPEGNTEILIKNTSEEVSYLHKPLFNENEINEFNADFLFALSIGLSQFDIQSSLIILTKLLDHIDFTNIEIIKNINTFNLVLLSVNHRAIKELQIFVKKLVDKNLTSLFQMFDIAYFYLKSLHEFLHELRIENLKYAVEKFPDVEGKGQISYNLGNTLRQRGNENLAFSYYLNAQKLDPNYLKRKYWWHELAGILFESGHYKFAENFYKKSIDIEIFKENKETHLRVESDVIKEDFYIYPLIADCLFFQGKFKNANEWFEKYSKQMKEPLPEWTLKSIACSFFCRHNLSDLPINKILSNDTSEEAIKSSDPNEVINKLERSIEQNPLNGSTWFNLGVIHNKENNSQFALFAFLLSGLINPIDKEAQINAFTLAFNQEEDFYCYLILHYMRDIHGESVMNAISDYFFNQKEIPLNTRKALLKGINEILNASITGNK